ncbi:MAG: aminopeptidase [Planctomycetes bacterium]|nr:aminopeptidase [Planctomycetota bacterium]
MADSRSTLLFSAALPLLLSGCYIIRQGCGQLDILLHRRNVDEVLAGPAPEPEKEKLKLVLEAKAFGERVLALEPTDNYTTFFDTRGKPVSYAVTACRKDRFEPYTWWFPIVGTIPYKGFFRREDAVEEARDLEAEGYDVNVGVVGAYSTLGWFSDPIFSSMLRQSEEELVDLILHELTHSTVYAKGHGDFNESLAGFVGREGALDFARRRWGERSEISRRAVDRFADEDRIDRFMQDLFRELDAYYRSRPANVLAGRAEIWAKARERLHEVQKELKVERYDWLLKVEVNNAVVLGRRRYGRTDLFRKHFEAVGGDWPKFFERMRAIAAMPDPIRALEESR